MFVWMNIWIQRRPKELMNLPGWNTSERGPIDGVNSGATHANGNIISIILLNICLFKRRVLYFQKDVICILIVERAQAQKADTPGCHDFLAVTLSSLTWKWKKVSLRMISYCAVMLGVHKHAHTHTNIHTNAHTYWQLREQVLPSFLNPALKQDLPP